MKSKVNEIKISYCEKSRILRSESLSGSFSTAKLLYENWDKDTIGLHESFKVLLLNNSNKVKGSYNLSMGGITGTLVDMRILFAVILKSLSTAIILAHNHPSGTLTPSIPDREITSIIARGADLFNIKLLDHLIITPDGSYYSFADEGLI